MIHLRRSFLKRCAALLAGSSLAGAATARPMKNPPFVHNVYFWMNNPDDAEARRKLEAGIKSLSTIKLVKSFHLGRPVPSDRDVVDGSYAYHLMLQFDRPEDQAAYQTAPVHEQFVTDCSNLWNRVQVYDSSADLV
ncbi:MAG: Dabb family protein [Tunicatimonas sp.]